MVANGIERKLWDFHMLISFGESLKFSIEKIPFIKELKLHYNLCLYMRESGSMGHPIMSLILRKSSSNCNFLEIITRPSFYIKINLPPPFVSLKTIFLKLPVLSSFLIAGSTLDIVFKHPFGSH